LGAVKVKQNDRTRQKWERRGALIRARTRAEDVEKLWESVSRNRRKLHQSENFPVLDSLEQSWATLNEFYGGIVKRDRDARVATTPFEAIVFHLEMGFYPPPELLLALADAYDVYRYSAGKITLEEAFFGPPRRKAGNHAKRRAQRAKLFWMSLEMQALVKEGSTKIQAAEQISERLGGTPEPESIIRMLNSDAFGRSINRL
jgi:hypothetical protein